MQTIDTLINARWVIPVEPDGRTLDHYSIAILGGKIFEVLPTADAAKHYRATETIDLPHHALIPGLVNAHTHAAMSLFRGLADDLPLMDWLNNHIWPAEAKWVGEAFVRDGTELAIAEMLKSGTTCFSDMYFFPEVTARACVDAGMRACIGLIMIDFPSAWAQNAEEYLHKGLKLHDELRNSDLVTTAFAPHAPYTVSDASFARIRRLADELDVPIHMHLHEAAGEVDAAVASTGRRPLARLDALGLVTPALIGVHATQLVPQEIALLASAGASVVHCPRSNAKLASGACPVAALLGAGVNVALGTDGAASNNRLDLFAEMQAAALLGKHVARDAAAVPAAAALAMATINGARALNLAGETGSLVPGKAADMICVDLADLALQPVLDPLSQLVYAASRNDVTDVWVAGEHLVSDRALVRLDVHAIKAAAQRWGRLVRGARGAT